MTCPITREPCAERWAACHEHDGYQVSSWGRVRNAATGRLLRLQTHSRGYRMVNLGSGRRNRLVHRLVAFAHLGQPPRDGLKYQVDHRNFDRRWNGVRNLRWMKATDNRWRWQSAEADPVEEARYDALAAAVAAQIGDGNGW